jgi:NAD(P)-dependent dehydrogenase (short-subunit alcohol dehydrogenase family)
VAIADLAPADETVAMVNDAGSEALAALCDVSSGESVRTFADAVAERFGHCDILVASAGIYPIAPLADTTWEQWRRVMSINLDSLFHLTQAFLPGMRQRGWGRIVAVASNLFYTGMAGMVPYVASKGGVVGFVRALAGEVGEDGVTVNAIAPSLVRTQGQRRRRLHHRADVPGGRRRGPRLSCRMRPVMKARSTPGGSKVSAAS